MSLEAFLTLEFFGMVREDVVGSSMTREARILSGKKIVSSVNGAWKLDRSMQKNNQTNKSIWTTFSHHETPRRSWQYFFGYFSLDKSNDNKKKHAGLYQTREEPQSAGQEAPERTEVQSLSHGAVNAPRPREGVRLLVPVARDQPSRVAMPI